MEATGKRPIPIQRSFRMEPRYLCDCSRLCARLIVQLARIEPAPRIRGVVSGRPSPFRASSGASPPGIMALYLHARSISPGFAARRGVTATDYIIFFDIKAASPLAAAAGREGRRSNGIACNFDVAPVDTIVHPPLGGCLDL